EGGTTGLRIHARLRCGRAYLTVACPLLEPVAAAGWHDGKGCSDTQFLRCIQWPVGVVQELPSNGHKICLSVDQNSFRLISVDDHAYGHRHDTGLVSNAFRKFDLISVSRRLN